MTVALTLPVSAIPLGAAEAASTPIVVGAVGGTSALAQASGAPLANHTYAQLSSTPPVAKMINMQPSVSWATVASANPGSSTYNDIVRWATTLKSRGGKIMFAFDHEPEAANKGQASDFIAAYRKVWTIFNNQGVTNVQFVWQMTSYAFTVGSSDRRAALKWYPGDQYVTHVGADPYNWYYCGPGQGTWQQLGSLIAAPLSFARSHGKTLVIAEYASQSGSLRAAWLNNERNTLLANKDTIRGVFYFQQSRRADCYFKLNTAAEYSAFGAMAKDTANFTAY